MPIALISERFSPGRLFSLPAKTRRKGWAALPVSGGKRSLTIVQETVFWFKPLVLAAAVALEKTPAAFLLIAESDTEVTLGLPLPGRAHRAWLEARQGKLGVAWEIDPKSKRAEIPVAFIATSSRPDTIVEQSLTALQVRLRTFRIREEKPVPAFVDWFGWCTWDAYYQKVTAAGVLRGLRNFARAGFAPGFLMLDDGWQDCVGWRLRSTKANRKFPGGLVKLVESARALGVRHFGVWHTLHGYWHGISSTGPISAKYRVVGVPQRTQDFHGWPEQFNPDVRTTLHPDDVGKFYSDFYAELAKAGVDFTKVDNQATTCHFAGESLPVAETFDAYQSAMQGAAANHLRSGTIHCMANCSDILWRHRTPSLWRNSDDFYPQKPFAAQAKHLVNNAYNAIFTGAFAIPDWDMFQSKHPYALFHAMARALSGGPVFVSDKPGKHDFSLLKRLVLPDGRVPRFPRPGLPPARTWFTDPLTGPEPLMLVNQHGPLSAIGLFHCSGATSNHSVQTKWSARQLGLKGEKFILHQPMTNEIQLVDGKEDRMEVLAAPGDSRLWTVAPLVGGWLAPLGLDSFFAAAATIDRAELIGQKIVRVSGRYEGTYLFWSATAPRSVSCEGKAVPYLYDRKTNFLRAKLFGTGAALVFQF